MDSSQKLLVHRRKSSLFKDENEEHKEALKKILFSYIILIKERHPEQYNAPYTWERLSTGYRVVDFKVDQLVEALELLKKHFFCTKRVCAASSVDFDSDTILLYQQRVADLASHETSFCAIEEGTGNTIGLAIATEILDDAIEDENENNIEEGYDLIQFEQSLLEQADIFDRYKIEKYFCVHIVCVSTDHHGKGIGKSLIQACLNKARKLNYSVCVGIFPAGPCLNIAQKLDFELLSEKPWRNVKIVKSLHQKSVMDFSKFEESFVACMGVVLPRQENENKSLDTSGI